MSASGLYTIDGLDFFDAFGWVINNSKTASNMLLAFPEADDPYSYRWQKEGITQYDLSRPTFLDKDVTFTGTIIASTKAEFWQKYMALWNLVKQPGERVIYSSELQQSFTCFYKKMPRLDRSTRLNDEDIIIDVDITFRIIFAEFVEPGGKQSQSITFPVLPSKQVGDDDFVPTVSASSGLPISLSSGNTVVATIVGNVIHILSAGTSVITASQSGDINYNPALNRTQILTVTSPTTYDPYSIPLIL